MIENIIADNATPYSGSFPTIAVQAGNRLYFYAKDAEHGRELWSIRPEKVRTINAVLAPIWEDKLKWPVAEEVRDLILATYLVAEGQTPRLVARKAIHLPTEPEPLRFLVLEIDQSRVETPDAFGLLGVVFDRRTGKKLDVGSELFGVATDSARVAIKRARRVPMKIKLYSANPSGHSTAYDPDVCPSAASNELTNHPYGRLN